MLRGRPPLDPRTRRTTGPVGLRWVDEIRQLLQLVDRGLLSEEEFEEVVLTAYGLVPGAGRRRRAADPSGPAQQPETSGAVDGLGPRVDP